MEEFHQGGQSANLNGRTNIELDSRHIVFHMEMFADTDRAPLLMHVMFDWFYHRAQSTDRRTQIAIDEVHYLLRRPEAQHLLNLMVRHSRHFNAGLTLISQTVEEFLTDDTSKEIFDQCDIQQVFHLKNPSETVVDALDLSPAERQFITGATLGEDSTYSECLLSVTGHGRKRIAVHTGEFEHHMLDDDLDPWVFLERAGVVSEAERKTVADQGRLGDAGVAPGHPD